jgi:nucleoside-diphosphate-sugar epimerase
MTAIASTGSRKKSASGWLQPEPLQTATQRVAVTGGTGFIGRALCARLRADGYPVRALVRNITLAADLAESGVTLVPGDLDDGDALRVLLDDCDVVIHLAGAVRGNSQQSFDRTNVRGTQNLLDALGARKESPRLLLISSLAAREPGLSWYARSKYQAEQCLHDGPPDLDWAIIRPPAVYGPGDKEMLPVFLWMARGIAPVPGDPAARVSLIHVEDLASAIVACLGLPRLQHRTFTLDDGTPGGYDWDEMAAIAGGVWQRKVRLVRLPGLLLDVLARANLALSRALTYAPMLTPAKLRELRHPNWVANNDDITAATGWRPRVRLSKGLEELKDSLL